jgi:hypothetical protein
MKRVMALATRVECNEESNGFDSKRDGNKGGRQSTATRAMATMTATMRVMVMATRLAGNKEGKGKGSKGDGDGDEGGGQRIGQWQWQQKRWQRQQGWPVSDGGGNKEGDGDANKGGGHATAAMMKRAMVTATRVAGDKEGNGNGGQSIGCGNKVGRQVTASRAMLTAMATSGQWQWQQGWQMTKRARARVARATEMTMRVVGNKEGEDSTAMAMATRVAGKWTATVTKRAMVTKTRLEGAWGGDDQPLCTTQQ